jgi:acyl-CoA dehydrogenase
MELLDMFGTDSQKKRWLEPLLNGEIRSGFSMTEPDVASSDARNIKTQIIRDGNDFVINGTKWWTTGAMDQRCEILIVMGKTNPDADDHHQQSMVLVPTNTPGVTVVRNLTVFGYEEQHGHAEISFVDVRVPVENLLGGAGEGFALAQARLGPGRIHHCMRAIGMAERALKLMIERAMVRSPFGKDLVQQGVVQEWIAQARIDIEQARLLVLKSAWMIDTHGVKNARKEIAAIKVAVPKMAERIIDHAIQSYGGAGVSQDTPLAAMYAGIRSMRIVDGPDEVHIRDIARLEIKNYLP